jgi:hypothetical protein
MLKAKYEPLTAAFRLIQPMAVATAFMAVVTNNIIEMGVNMNMGYSYYTFNPHLVDFSFRYQADPKITLSLCDLCYYARDIIHLSSFERGRN